MKATSILFLVVFIAAFVGVMASFANDLNAQYPEEHQINTSKYEGKYDYSENINDSVGKLKSNFDTITDTDKSWFTRIGAGIVAIPYAVILFPLTIFDGFASFGNILTGMTQALGVPPFLISAGLLILVIFAVIKLLEFFQRSPA